MSAAGGLDRVLRRWRGRTPAAWAPRALGLTFDFDPFVASTLTLSSGRVSQATDAAGGALVLAAPGTAPELDSTHTANGRPCIVLTHAGNERLRTTSGGLTGAADHHLVAVAQRTADESSYGSIAAWGQEASGTSNVGAYTSTKWWGGGNGLTNPQGGTPDKTTVHVISKSNASGTTTLRVDGVIVGQAAAVYNLSAGLGVIGWAATTLQSAYLYRAIWVPRALERSVDAAALADRQRLEHYLAVTYGLSVATRPLVQCVGDSLTYGYLASDPATTSYPPRLAAHGLSASTDVTNLGVFGRQIGPAATSSTMLNLAPTQEDWRVSWCRPRNIIVIWGGTNDIRNGRSAADTWADIQTYCTDRRLTGAKVVLCSIIPRKDDVAAGVESERLALNALIRAGWGDIADAFVDLDADPRFANTSDLTYFNADGVHLSDTGYDVVAELIAPTLIGFGV